LDGMSRWWLSDFGTKHDVQAALESLVAQGVVTAKESPFGAFFYCAAKRQRNP
jgi:hypothetical protein